jgi:hypothetical protein
MKLLKGQSRRGYFMTDDRTMFFTGFTWEENKEIHKAVQNSYRDSNGDIEDFLFDFPDYGGLPDNISQRLTGEQVDYLQESQPTTFEQTARILAKGH